MKVKIQELKLQNDEDEGEIREWSASIDKKLAMFEENNIAKLESVIKCDWLRFWKQFQAEIEAGEIPVVSKFSYLKKLFKAKVRSCVDGLPLTSKWYERAKIREEQ